MVHIVSMLFYISNITMKPTALLTNIISELIRPRPDKNVIAWVNRQPLQLLYTTAISKAELYYGIRLQSEGKRREQLSKAVNELFRDGLDPRLLSFDSRCTEFFAEIASSRRFAGLSISIADAQIAAICRQRQMTLVTRNNSDFSGCGIEMINPFDV